MLDLVMIKLKFYNQLKPIKMIKLLFTYSLILITIFSCNRVETTVELTVTEFESNSVIEDVDVEVYEISNIEQGSNGVSFDRELVNNLRTNEQGIIQYSTKANFERLEFDLSKNRYVNTFSADQFFIENGDNLALQLEMNREAFIKFIIIDDPMINQGELRVLADVFDQGNDEHIFTSGDAELIKQVRGNTETDVWITRNMSITTNNPTFVSAGDTLDFEISY